MSARGNAWRSYHSFLDERGQDRDEGAGRARIAHEPLEFRRRLDDRARCHAQAVDGFDRKRERCRQAVEIRDLGLVGERGKGDVDRVDVDRGRADRGGEHGIARSVERRRFANAALERPTGFRVAQQLDGLEREVINRHARGLEQDCERARRVDRDVPVRGRTRQRIDDEDRDPAHAVERCRPAQRVLGFQRFEDVEHTAQPEVVGDATVDEMDVGLCARRCRTRARRAAASCARSAAAAWPSRRGSRSTRAADTRTFRHSCSASPARARPGQPTKRPPPVRVRPPPGPSRAHRRMAAGTGRARLWRCPSP